MIYKIRHQNTENELQIHNLKYTAYFGFAREGVCLATNLVTIQ